MRDKHARLLASVVAMLAGAMIMLSAHQLDGDAERNVAAGGFFVAIVCGLAALFEYLRCHGD